MNGVVVERVENLILLIRGQKVIRDSDLAVMYGVTTFNLNKAVKRNLERFPADFMFQLNREEFRQAPLGRPQTPSRTRSLIRARQRTSPRSLKTRTSSRSEIPRAAASAGLSVSQSSG